MGVVNEYHMLGCSGWYNMVKFKLFLSQSYQVKGSLMSLLVVSIM